MKMHLEKNIQNRVRVVPPEYRVVPPEYRVVPPEKKITKNAKKRMYLLFHFVEPGLGMLQKYAKVVLQPFPVPKLTDLIPGQVRPNFEFVERKLVNQLSCR